MHSSKKYRTKRRSMTISWSCALLHVLCGTLGLVDLSGHLLHHGMTLLSGGWKTFLDRGPLTFFIILVPGDWSLLGLASLLGYIITDLALGSNIMANRIGCRLTLLPTGDRAFLH